MSMSASAVGAALLTKFAPTLGVGICNKMFLSPMKAVRDVRKAGKLGALNPDPWVAMVGNTAAWTGYGVATLNPFVFLANAPGLLLGLFYTQTAIVTAPEGTSKRVTRQLQMYLTLVGGPPSHLHAHVQSLAWAQAQA